jgi:hypothetical protein
MRTGELKKISKAPVETLESWHASISRNPESMTMMVRDLDVALHKLGGPKPADTEKRNDISKAVHGAGQALLKAAHSPFGHAVTWTANALAATPDGGNVKRNLNEVVKLSKSKKISENNSLATKALAALGQIVDAQQTPVQQTPQAAATASVEANKAAMAAVARLEAARRVLAHATALQDDLRTALSDVDHAAGRLTLLLEGRTSEDVVQHGATQAQRNLAAAQESLHDVQMRVDTAQGALDEFRNQREEKRQELDTIRSLPQSLADAEATLEQLNDQLRQASDRIMPVDAQESEVNQMAALGQQIEEQTWVVAHYRHQIGDQTVRDRENVLARELEDPVRVAAADVEETFLREDYETALSLLEDRRRVVDNASTALSIVEPRIAKIQDLLAIQKNGQPVAQSGLDALRVTIDNAQVVVDEASGQCDTAYQALRAAEQNERTLAILNLPGFDPRRAVADELRAALRQIGDQLGERPLDLNESRVPSSTVLNVVIGALAESVAPKRADESYAAAADRRLNEARQILEMFSQNLPPTGSQELQRWHAAIKSLPGGLRAFEQLSHPPYDEEKPVVLATQVASHARAQLEDPAHPPQETDRLQGVMRAAAEVVRTGRTDGLSQEGRQLYETALDGYVVSRQAASDVETVATAANAQPNVPESVQAKNAAALRVAGEIRLHGHANNLTSEERAHYEDVLKDTLVTKRTAAHAGERARGTINHNVSGADRAAMKAAARAADQITSTGSTHGVAAEDLAAYNALLKAQNAVKRTATIVEALARNMVDRKVEGTDPYMLNDAAAGAAEIARKGHDYDLPEAQRAHYYAVRNGFISPQDPKILKAEAGFDKLNNEWLQWAHDEALKGRLDSIPRAKLKKANPNAPQQSKTGRQLTRENTAATKEQRAAAMEAMGERLPAKGWLHLPRNTLQNKTPFSPPALREGNTISMLGYSNPARPMQRLDEVVGRVMKHLNNCVKTILPQSLSVDRAIKLAAVLVTQDKVNANPNIRPGHMALERSDVRRISDRMKKGDFGLLLNRLPGSGDDLPASITSFIGDGGKKIADALVLNEFVDDIIHRIPRKLADGSDNVHRSDLVEDIGIVADMCATEITKEVHNPIELYQHLKPKIQQLELRGKEKTSSGGVAGLSSKLVTFPVTFPLEFMGIPKAALGASRVRHAVFEIGFSTTGFEIFIGSETRKTGSITGGFGFRHGAADLIGAGAAGEKVLTADKSSTPGIWLKFPRGDGDEVVRDRALAALQTLLGIKDDNGNVTMIAADSAEAKVDGTALPPRAAKLLANNPNMSMSLVADYEETNFRNENLLAGSLPAVKMGTDEHAASVILAQGTASTARRSKRLGLSDATGYMRVTRSNIFSGGIAFGQGVIGGITEPAASGSPGASVGFGSALAHSRQVKEKGIDTKYRGITRDGEINAVDTRIDKENLSLENHLKRIDADRRAWIECGVNELFKDPNDPTPLREKIRIVEAWLEDHLAAVKGVASDNARHVFSLSYSLKPAVGAMLDGMVAQAELHKRQVQSEEATNGNAAENRDHIKQYNHLLETFDKVLADQSSWREWKITASEWTSEKVRKGFVAGAEFVRSYVAEG